MAKNDPCWDGFKQVGMKKGKGGKMVPNCVPTENGLVFRTSETISSTRQQARAIRNEALQMIDSANEFTTNTRRVNRRSAFRVISRSLHTSEGLPFSVRKHQALTELSNYIALAKHNKVVGLTAFNTDLLPLTHPRSTRAHSMTASAMIRSHVKWVTDDPRITDDTARALIASAMLAPLNSPEKLYALTRLENLPQGHVPLEAMTAAFGGGNSAAARSARVALQLRDRLGRWVEMFGGLGVKVKRRDGSTQALTGRAVGQNIFSPQLADVELEDGRIVALPIRQARGSDFLASPAARKDGFTPAGSAADDMGDPIIDEADLTFMESPSSFEKASSGQGVTRYTDQAYDVVKFDDNKRALADLTASNKIRAEKDLDDAAVDKKGEIDADSGKQFWDPTRPIYAVSRRGGTPFAYTQSWNDAQQRIAADQVFLDEEEGRKPIARITQDDNTPEDEVPLVDQQDKLKADAVDTIPEADTPAPADFKYKVPEDSYEITNPKAPYRSVSEYDDPASLANMFQGDELIDALDDSLDTGLGRLQFPEEGEDRGGEQEVPAEAILKAIDEKGGDAELALAQAYDKRLGTSENEDALYAKREANKESKMGGPKKLGEVFDEVTTAPEEEPAKTETPIAELPEITEDVEPTKLPSALEGLTEEEKAAFEESGDYTPFIPKNTPIEWPEGFTPPQDRELTEQERADALELANSEISDDDLIGAYSGAIKNQFDENGSAPFLDIDENNEEQVVQVPSEVIRDAIKLRDYDGEEVDRAVISGAYDEPEEEVAPIKFKKNKDTGRMEYDIDNNTVVSYGKDDEGNWAADAIRFSRDGGVDSEEYYPAKNKAEARKIAEDVINSYKETQDIIDPDDLPDQTETEEDVAVGEEPAAPEVPTDSKGSRSGKDPLKEGWTPEEWIYEGSKDPRFHEMLRKNKDFTRLAAFFNDPSFDSPLMSDYQDREMEGFESGSEVEAIDRGERFFNPSPSASVQYALDILEDPTRSMRGGFNDFRTGERSNQNLKNILNAADEQLAEAKDNLSDSDVIENKAIDSVRATLAKEIAKLDKQIEKDKKKAEEDAIAPQVKYLLRGDRLELRHGKKAPFKRQEVKDFLDDNGFEWTDSAKAETKSGMDEAKSRELLRQLRDRFGIEISPRDGQTPFDLDAIDETPEPAVEEVSPEVPKGEAPITEPKKKSLASREDEEFKDLLFPGGTPEGWTFEEDGGFNGLYYIRDLTKENGDRIQGVYPKDEERPPYYLLDLATDGVENRGSFKSLQEVLDFYNSQSSTEEVTPESPVEEIPAVEEPVVETPETPIPSSLNDKLLKRDGIQMIKITGPNGEQIETPVFKIAGRPMVLININGVRIPFYISTGSGGKKNVPVGEWYPIFGIGPDGWFNKGTEEEINDFFGSPELREAAEWLNANIGDIRKEDMPSSEDSSEEFRAQINQDLSPGKYYESYIVIRNRALALAKIRGDQEAIKEEEALLKKYLEQKAEFKAKLKDEEGITSESTPEQPQDEEATKDPRASSNEDTVLEEALLDALTGEGPKPTLSELIDRLKRKLTNDEEVVGEFGTRGDMISKLMWAKWGAGLRRMESPYIQRSMSAYKKQLKSLSNEELIEMVNNYFDEIDANLEADREQTERARKIAQARARKRREREDELIREPEEKPTPAPAQPVILTPEEVAEQDRQRRLKEIRDRQKREREDKLLEEEEKRKTTPATPAEPVTEEIPEDENESEVANPEIKSNPETPRVISALTTELRPGDITASDFFTITKIEPGETKLKNKTEVPASRIYGYYPGSVEQKTKVWADDASFKVFRGTTPPASGDLPEISKPELRTEGTEPLEVVGKDDNGNKIYELKDKVAQAEYESKMAVYREELAKRMALWQAPEVQEEAPTFTSENTLHVVNPLGKDLKPGDIAFRRNKDDKNILGEFFVIEEVLPGTVMVPRLDGKPAEEKVQIRGYYPGHQSQVKSWRVGTGVEALRGEKTENLPAKGDKPGIDSIEPGALSGKPYSDKNKEISALREEAGKAYTPNLQGADIPRVLLEEPNSFFKGNLPAFLGSAKELAKLKDGPAIWKALQGKKVVYFDFETIGKGFDMDEPDQPIQLAAAVYENGEKVGEINLFINPGVPLNRYYYEEGKGKNAKPYIDKETGEVAINPDRLINNDGVAVDDAFLATQPSIEEQLRKFAELIGKDAILVAHNAEFDTNTFEKWAQKLGIPYEFGGVIDTIELARTSGKKFNDLEAVSKRYGIEKDPSAWHNAATDSEVLPEILEKLLTDMKSDNPQFDPDARMEQFKAARSSYLRQLADWRKQQSELAAATMATVVKDGMEGKPVNVDSLTETPSQTFGPDGATDSGSEYQYDSIFGGKITNDWIEDDENTYIVDEGFAKVQDIKVGDFVPALEGGYHEVIELQKDPEDENGTIVVRRIVASGEIYSTRVTDKSSPGIGWANGKTLQGTLRRRNEFIGKSNDEIKKLLDLPVVKESTPRVKQKTTVPKGSKTARPDQIQGTVGDAIKTITSGAKSGSSVKEAVKGLPIDDTTKTLVIAEGTEGSKYHLSSNGTPLKVGDKVRNAKNGRIGEVRAFIGSYTDRGYKNYVKVKFDDASKRENISSKALEIINPDDGGGFFKDMAPLSPQSGDNTPVNPTPVTPEEFGEQIKATATKAEQATDKIAAALIAAIEAGTVPWRKPWSAGGIMPISVSTGKMYEGSNILTLWAAQAANGWTDNRWMTFAEAKKRGGSVIRGQKATKVVHYPQVFEDVIQPDGSTKREKVFVPPKVFDVFNAEQTVGVNLPPMTARPPIPVSEAEQLILDTYKDRPEIFYKSQDNAYYSPTTDTIHLPLRSQFGSEQDLFETLVHELAHSTGHPSRVNRKELLDNYGNHKASRGEEELIAEITVALVAARLGVEIDFGNVAAYAKNWLEPLKNDPQMVVKAARRAQKAMDHMLGKQEDPAKVDEDGTPTEPVGEGVGSEGLTGDQIAEDAGLKPETAPEPNVGEEGTTGEEIAGEEPTTPEINPEPNVGEQGRAGEEIASEDDIKSAGTKGGHDLSPREVFNNNLGRSDRDINKVYAAEAIWAPMSNPTEYPVAPKREDFQDRDSYLAAYKKYAKDYDDAYRESTKYIESPIGEKNLDGSQKGVQNYVKDVITADWFVEAFGNGKRIGRPPVTLFTSKKEGGRYSYGFKNNVFISALKINKLLSKNETNILHEISHFATVLSVGDGFDGHGVEFRMNYIYITNKVLGREAAEGLKEAYRKDNLDVG